MRVNGCLIFTVRVPYVAIEVPLTACKRRDGSYDAFLNCLFGNKLTWAPVSISNESPEVASIKRGRKSLLSLLP